MPKKPPTPCSYPGCPNLSHTKFCDEHKQYETEKRQSSAKRGYNKKWQIARSRYLKENPFCVRCKANGTLVKATVIDHIIPHRGDGVLFWNKSNWQPLCKKCHDRKTRTEDQYPVYTY